MEHRFIELDKHLDLPFNHIIKSYDRFFFGKQVLHFNTNDIIKGVCIISNSLFATISFYNKITIWNCKGEIQHVISPPSNYNGMYKVISVNVWKDNLVIGLSDGLIRIYNLTADEYFDLNSIKPRKYKTIWNFQDSDEESDGIYHMDIKDDLLLVKSDDYKLSVWDLKERNCILQLKESLFGAKFIDSAIIGTRDGKLITFNLQIQEETVLEPDIVDIGWIININNKIIVNCSNNKLLIYSDKLEHLYTSKTFKSSIVGVSLCGIAIFIYCLLESYIWELDTDIYHTITTEDILSKKELSIENLNHIKCNDIWFLGDNMNHFPNGRLLISDGATIRIIE